MIHICSLPLCLAHATKFLEISLVVMMVTLTVPILSQDVGKIRHCLEDYSFQVHPLTPKEGRGARDSIH